MKHRTFDQIHILITHWYEMKIRLAKVKAALITKIRDRTSEQTKSEIQEMYYQTGPIIRRPIIKKSFKIIN